VGKCSPGEAGETLARADCARREIARRSYSCDAAATTGGSLRPPSGAANPNRAMGRARITGQKVAAMNARMPAPKPTTALLLNEIQVIGISRSPRGYAAIVEATPIKLTYVIYPGEPFFDGQLVAIEDNRLVFRRETVFTDGRRERSVEYKPLRQPGPVNSMTVAGPNPSVANAQP